MFEIQLRRPGAYPFVGPTADDFHWPVREPGRSLTERLGCWKPRTDITALVAKRAERLSLPPRGLDTSTSEFFEFDTTSTEALKRFGHAIRRLDEIGGLRRGWYDEESPSIGSAAIGVARSIVTELAISALPTPSIFPAFDGGLSLEWTLKRLKAEIILASDGETAEISDWHPDTGEHTYNESIEIEVRQIRDWIAGLDALQ